jgi:signal transduction histidine kinase
VWGGAIVYPFVLFLALNSGREIFGSPRIVLPILVALLPLGLLRRKPLAGLIIMLAGTYAVVQSMEASDAYLQLLVINLVVIYIAATRSRRVSLIAVALVLVVEIGAATVHTVPISAWLAFALLTVATTWLIGNSIRQRRAYAETLREQAAAQAVTAERLRIARELHDMVAHSIGIIAIQAGVGSRVMDTQPAEARKSLTTIEATSRETLAALRRTLVALRQPETDGAPRGPAPGLADVDRLAAATLDAGVRVDLRWQGERRPIPDDIDLSAFRIIQESLTNVVRHAGTPECQVVVDYRDAELVIEVADEGKGCPVVGMGYGILGMRERVGLLHGQFAAGPRPEGGFLVTARLPTPQAA